MPRSSGPEMPPRRSPRGPSQLRTSSSDPESMHHRATGDSRSPKLGGDRRSPRGPQSETVNQKKLGTRIADLESQLGQAQEELKNLKGQLVSAEAAKKAAQEQLEKKSKKKPLSSAPAEIQNKIVSEMQNPAPNRGIEVPEDNQPETDVFEVPMENVTVQPQELNGDDDLKTKSQLSPTSTVLEAEKPPFDELALKNGEITALNTKLTEMEKELEVSVKENESLKSKLEEKSLEVSASQLKEAETRNKLNEVTKELEESKNNAVQINEKLDAVEKAKEELETEMKKLRVQTEQWRKAADAAAAVLSGGVETNGRRISERCGSMDKQHFGSVFEAHGGGYNGYMGSPGIGEDGDDVFGGGKRKGSGIKMFDLWKKKGQK
ncbi:OLC1v1023409C1 [Oldenlandia corymbosa var. corymbosa]|uniref:OLC1v1023409C1 n=1 Tax=Oldenlandia corymbosa var. corymbosa TaxID=529605 RepID=A0AAV1BZY1_OLDCO|nr:OLC1v1023409C1 [Oldenlandia corymbosa var. corymbosa]